MLVSPCRCPEAEPMSTRTPAVGGESFQIELLGDVADIPQPGGIEELVQQIKDTADKLLRDKANRGDVKLLSTALRELRYAFKVFAPVRGRRKVTVFGSARTPPDNPSYKQAVDFGRL